MSELRLRLACCALLSGLALTATAACTRPIVVPVTSASSLVRVNGGAVSGVLPDLLQELGRRGGCSFSYSIMPRARWDMTMVPDPEVDLIFPISAAPARDRYAVFVPLLSFTLGLVQLKSSPQLPSDVAALRAGPWRGASSRTYNFNPEFRTLIDQLHQQGKMDFTNDLETIGRMLDAGRVQYTILPFVPSHGAFEPQLTPGDPASRYRHTRLTGLPKMHIGVYLSRRRLAPGDLEQLRSLLDEARRDGTLRRVLRQHYPAALLAEDGL